METERGHVSVKRGVSWSPGGVRKPLQVGQDADTSFTESDASSERRDYMEAKGQPAVAPCTNQMAHKTSLTRSASLSEKELKEARVRSQIIAAQLTVPSNSNSRGVQLFNRRKQRVNAFTLQGGGGAQGSGREEAENEKGGVPPLNNLTWAARASEGKDRELNCKNSASKPPCAPGRLVFRGSDIMEDPGEPILELEPVPEDSIIQERHFQPVNEKEEEEEEEVKVKQQEVKEEREEVPRELEDEVRSESAPQSDRGTVQREPVQGEAGMNGVYTEPVPPGHLPNGCHSSQGPGKVSVSLSRQAPAIVNRTARPFFSPATVRSPEARSPVAEIPPAPSYSTPPLPLPRPVAFSPPPPPPSYPTPPLPAFTSQPPQSFSGPPPVSTVTSPAPPPPACQYAPPPACQYAPPSAPAVSRYVPPAPRASQHAPPTAPRPSAFVPRPSAFVPRPSTFVPQPSAFVPRPLGEWRPQSPIKSGILEEGAAKRGTRKSMFTFKEKPVVAPNPELLSLVQGADERKKQGPRSAPEPVSEEELLALGAEASNFLTRQLEAGAEDDAAPEWSSTLRSSSTRARAEHKPEQNLTNVSGKGAELFAKRQSRMEKFVLESQNAGQTRSPSPTMSLPPSWVYPSNMPGRVKAIANNSNISEQLTRTMKAQQPVQKKPVQRAPAPPPVSPPLENGCTKIEMELSKHQPYQLNSSLFIFNPVKDPTSSLPRAAPPPKPVVTSFSRQASQPSPFSSQPSFRSAHCPSPQLHPSPAGGTGPGDYPPNYRGAPSPRQSRITSPVSAFSPERVVSPRSGVQAPRPTFSAKKAGIEPQARKESPSTPTPTQTPTPSRTPQFTRRFSSPEGPCSGAWSPSPQGSQPSSITTTSRPLLISTATSPVSPPWETRCQSPMVYQPSQASSATSTSRPLYPSTATSPISTPRQTRCLSPNVSSLDSKANHRLLAKNIINAAKRKNSPSPGALSGHSLPISPLGGPYHQAYEHGKPPFSPFQSRALGAQSPPFASPPATPTRLIRSPVRLYNTRSLTDSDASVESEDSGLRSPGLRSYNTCPRGWGGSLRVKRGSVSTDL